MEESKLVDIMSLDGRCKKIKHNQEKYQKKLKTETDTKETIKDYM